MADVPLKASLPRKSAFSCEACRKRKVSPKVYNASGWFLNLDSYLASGVTVGELHLSGPLF